MSTTVDFAAIIAEDRKARTQEEWQGTFLEYLEKVKTDPALSYQSHRRFYDMLMSKGVHHLRR